MSYSVYLVDNELWAIVYLKEMLAWEEHGFHLIGESTNSVKALEEILALKPDVVFTDIRMPELTGLQLMQKANEAGTASKFVILSGFAEFSYAQEAVRLGAFDYCLKPLSPDDGNEVLKKLAKVLSEEAQASLPHQPDGSAAGAEPAAAASAPEAPSDNETFNQIVAYIQDHYQEKLRLKDIAQHFFLSAGYCSVLFSRYLNMTFPEYLTDLRIKKACQLLDTTPDSTEVIAGEVGIEDYFYFNKVFKKLTGMTPRQYRRRNLALSDEKDLIHEKSIEESDQEAKK